MSASFEYYNMDSNNNSLGGSVTTVKTTMSQEGKAILKEGFSFVRDAPNPMSMTTDISGVTTYTTRRTGRGWNYRLTTTATKRPPTNLLKNLNEMSANNTVYDLSTNVIDPYGYGYIPSLEETRNQDALNLLQQENSVFVMGAIAGVSMIVLGIVMAASASVSPE